LGSDEKEDDVFDPEEAAAVQAWEEKHMQRVRDRQAALAKRSRDMEKLKENEKKKTIKKRYEQILADNDTSVRDYDADTLLELNWFVCGNFFF
jgi:hypothetical protein